MPKFKINDIVRILPYKDDEMNCEGRVNHVYDNKNY